MSKTPALEFFEALWPTPPTEGNFSLVDIGPDGDREHAHIPVDSELLREILAEPIDGSRNLLYGVGLRGDGLTTHEKGSKADIVAFPAFFLDIDFFHEGGAHKAKNLPKNLDEALGLIERAGVPFPSIVVKSGHGVHLYWVFGRFVMLESIKDRARLGKALRAFQKPIIEAFKAEGFHLDGTFDITRELRVPGSTNLKSGAKVELYFCDPSIRYDIEDLVPENVVPGGKVNEFNHRPIEVATVRDALERLAKNAKHTDKEFAAALSAAAHGESIAEPGGRDAMLQRVCSALAWAFKTGDPENIAEAIRPSLQVWASEPDADKTVEDELKKAIDKITRSQQDWAAQQAEKVDDSLEAFRQKAITGALSDIELEEPETAEGQRTRTVLKRASIIQFRNSFWVWSFKHKCYSSRTLDKSELVAYCCEHWDGQPGGYDMTYFNDQGVLKTQPVKYLTDEFCTVAKRVQGSFTIRDSYYDTDTETFHEAVCPIRDITPEFIPIIDEWLKVFAGEEYYEILCDWIAAVPLLDRINTALYLDGPAATGKSLLANGLAKLWHDGSPSDLERALTGSFNETLLQCPLAWVDEGVDSKNVANELRSLVTQTSFEINGKYQAPRPVRGSVRAIICANNPHALMLGDDIKSPDDLAAIAQRFVYIKVQPEAAEFLKEHRAELKQWNDDGYAIAQHCLYLSQNRTIKNPGSRFLVEGGGDMFQTIGEQDKYFSLICEWVARFAENPQPLDLIPGSSRKARCGEGELLVNSKALIDFWTKYIAEDRREKPSSPTKAGHVLSRLSGHTKRVQRTGFDGKRSNYYKIDLSIIHQWAEDTGIADTDDIFCNVHRTVPEDIAAKRASSRQATVVDLEQHRQTKTTEK